MSVVMSWAAGRTSLDPPLLALTTLLLESWQLEYDVIPSSDFSFIFDIADPASSFVLLYTLVYYRRSCNLRNHCAYGNRIVGDSPSVNQQLPDSQDEAGEIGDRCWPSRTTSDAITAAKERLLYKDAPCCWAIFQHGRPSLTRPLTAPHPLQMAPRRSDWRTPGWDIGPQPAGGCVWRCCLPQS